MALAEEITPLFFLSVTGSEFFGKRLTGATLDPFTGQLCETSLSMVIWELAVAFGCLRLTSSENDVMTIAAFGNGLSWSPYQSHADLLWCDHSAVPAWPSAGLTAEAGEKPPETIPGKTCSVAVGAEKTQGKEARIH